MFEDILKIVKEHFGNNSEVASVIPQDRADDIHQEIATHINNHLEAQPAATVNAGGMLSSFQNSLGSGNMLTSAIEGGLVSSLASKFGLSPLVTGAIAGALPGLLQKLAHRNQ